MTQQRIRDTCDDCKCEIDMTVAQTVINRNLKWYKSYSCPFCGSALELDGDSFPPNEIRKIFLDNEGEWSISFGEQDIYKVAIMKILRQNIDISISQVNQMLKQFPNSLISGTKTEMAWIKSIFESAGIQVSLVPGGCDRKIITFYRTKH